MRYPDLFEVGCNAVSLVFFGLMFIYVQSLMLDEVKAKFDGKGKKDDDLYSQEYDQTTGKYSFRPEWEEFLIHLVNFD